MTEQTPSGIAPRRRRWRIVLIAIVTLVFILFAAVQILNHQAAGQWQAYVAQLEASGQPMTRSGFLAKYPPPADDRNGARIIESLTGEEPPQPGAGSRVLVFDESVGGPSLRVPPDTIEPSRAYLAANQAVLEALRGLADRPTGAFAEPAGGDPIANLLPLASRVRHLSKLLRLEAVVHLIDGQAEDAAEVARLQFHASGTLDGNAALVAWLVAGSCDVYALDTVRQLVRAGPVPVGSLRMLQDEIRLRRAAIGVRRSLQYERAHLADILGAGLGPAPDWRPVFLPQWNQQRMAEYETRLINAATDPAGLCATARKVDGEVTALGSVYDLVKACMPPLVTAARINARVLATLDSSAAGLAAERYRVDHGAMPASLDVLVPQYLDAIPVDPFDGKPLRFARTDDGIVIYSVGENERDDGGVLVAEPSGEDKTPTGRPPDIGFPLVNPERRGVVIEDTPK